MFERVISGLVSAAVLGLAAASAAGEDDRPQPADWESALAVLRAAESYDEEATGEGGDKSPTYLAYEVFRDGAPVGAVRGLTTDANPIVRAYAVRALVQKHAEDTPVYELVATFLDDHQQMLSFSGCCGVRTMVGDVVLDLAHPLLSADERDRVLARLLETRSPLWFRADALRNGVHSEAWYDTIRPLALEGDRAALVALARFRRAEDLPLVAKALAAPAKEVLRDPDVLRAAHAYADPALFSRLSELEPGMGALFNGSNAAAFRLYFGAVAAQRPAQAEVVLLRVRDRWTDVVDDRRELLEQIAEIAESEDLYAFGPILSLMWERDAVVSPAVVRHLYELDPHEIFLRMTIDLADRASVLPARVLDVELELFAASDQKRAEKLVSAALRDHATLRNTRVLSRYAAAWKPPEAVEPLLHIVATEWNPHRYLPAARALLCFADSDIDTRLAACTEKNAALSKHWGGERFARMLREKPRAWSDD